MNKRLIIPVVCCLALTRWAKADEKPPFAVTTVANRVYYQGKDADPVRHKLDLYLPKGKLDFPVLMFVHGGSFRAGAKEDFAYLGKALAGEGIGVVAINYRLNPNVTFPDHVVDVARAFAWVHANIAPRGGRADRIFVGGHSAGALLASLIATDASYLKAQKLSLSDIRGVISISGRYDVARGTSSVFPDSDEGVRSISPRRHVVGKHPPFLILYGENDMAGFGDMAEDFAKALTAVKCEVTCEQIRGRDHGTVVSKIGDANDPTRKAVLDFVNKHR